MGTSPCPSRTHIPRVLDWVMHLAKLVICIAVILSKGASIAKDSQEPLLTETEKLDAVLHLLRGHEETTMKYASINAWG